MDFEAAAPGWWVVGGALGGIVLAALAWAEANRRYPDESFKRGFFRLFSVFVGILVPVIMFLANTETIRIRGEEVEARHDFQLEMRRYRADDIVSWNFGRAGGGGGTRGGGSRYTELVVRFRDGYAVGIAEGFDNYDRLRQWLEGRGVQQR